MDNQGYYAILGVSQKANFQEIKKSYRRLEKNITLTETNPPMQKRQAPKVFVVDKNKHINPKARVQSETADTLDRIVMAVQACPTKAIKIIDRYTGNQIYP